MTQLKKWHIHEGFYIQEEGGDFLSIVDPEGGEILFTSDMINDMTDALGRASIYYAAKKLGIEQSAALARWGKERIPT